MNSNCRGTLTIRRPGRIVSNSRMHLLSWRETTKHLWLMGSRPRIKLKLMLSCWRHVKRARIRQLIWEIESMTFWTLIHTDPTKIFNNINNRPTRMIQSQVKESCWTLSSVTLLWCKMNSTNLSTTGATLCSLRDKTTSIKGSNSIQSTIDKLIRTKALISHHIRLIRTGCRISLNPGRGQEKGSSKWASQGSRSGLRLTRLSRRVRKWESHRWSICQCRWRRVESSR